MDPARLILIALGDNLETIVSNVLNYLDRIVVPRLSRLEETLGTEYPPHYTPLDSRIEPSGRFHAQ
jgi:hypothetical protein